MFLLPLVLSACFVADPLIPGDHTRTLEHDGRTRTYIVHVPPKYDPKQPTPVVLAFHGGGSNAEQMVRFCGLNGKADQDGSVVVVRLQPSSSFTSSRITGTSCQIYTRQVRETGTNP